MDPTEASTRVPLPKPGFWLCVLLCVLVIGIQMVLAMPLVMVDGLLQNVFHKPALRFDRDPLALAVINYVAIGVPIAFGLYLNRLSFKSAFPWVRLRLLHFVGIIICLLGAIILLSEADNFFRWAVPMPEWMRKLAQELFFPPGRIGSQIFLLVITAPLTEELLFRGVIMRGLLWRHRPFVAILVAALLFGAVHLNPWQFMSAGFLGLFLGWFYLRTGSVWTSVFGHAVANGLFLLATIVPYEIQGLTGHPDPSRVVFQPWWLDLCGLALTGLGLWIIARNTSKPVFSRPEIPPEIPASPSDQPPIIVT